MEYSSDAYLLLHSLDQAASRAALNRGPSGVGRFVFAGSENSNAGWLRRTVQFAGKTQPGSLLPALGCERRLAHRWLAVPALAGLPARAALTARELSDWGDNVTLWTHTNQVTGDDFVAPDNLGQALALEGKLDRAMPHFRKAAKINPLDPVSNLNVAANEQEHGNLSSAVPVPPATFFGEPDAYTL
jgi:tetratricopeptide (TPR) repeat protein